MSEKTQLQLVSDFLTRYNAAQIHSGSFTGGEADPVQAMSIGYQMRPGSENHVLSITPVARDGSLVLQFEERVR